MTDGEYIDNAIQDVETFNAASKNTLRGRLIGKHNGWMPGSVPFWFDVHVFACSFHIVRRNGVFEGKLIELRGLRSVDGGAGHFIGIYFVYDYGIERLTMHMGIDGNASSRFELVAKDDVGMCDVGGCMKELCRVIWKTIEDIFVADAGI